MPTPKELTLRFMDAYKERDRVALRDLLAPVLEYVRPGGGTLRTADAVMDQYERDWAVAASSRVEVQHLIESDDGIMAEISIHATVSGRSLAVDGALAHGWRDEPARPGGRSISTLAEERAADLGEAVPPPGLCNMARAPAAALTHRRVIRVEQRRTDCLSGVVFRRATATCVVLGQCAP